MNIYSLKIGDLIVKAKGVFSTHYMVYVGIHNGVRMVAENQVGYGVRYISLTAALAGNSIVRTEKFTGTERERNLVISKINKLVGRAYDLVKFNCEHFARSISKGKKESMQVKNTYTGAILAGGAMLFSNNPGVKALGLLSIIGGMVGHASQE